MEKDKPSTTEEIASEHTEPVPVRTYASCEQPIFIVGNARSGTSALYSTLAKVTGRHGYGEGHLYPILRPVLKATQPYYGTTKNVRQNDQHQLTHFKQHEVREAIAKAVGDLMIESYGRADFLDKTPGPKALAALPFVRRGFPDMKVIYAKRRGIEVVRSSVKKFPHAKFGKLCMNWAQSFQFWEEAKPEFEGQYLEVEQRLLERNPDAAGRMIADFLTLEDGGAEAIANYLRSDRPQSSGALNKGDFGVEDIGWTQSQINGFRLHCADIMERWGYSEGPEYFLDGSVPPELAGNA